MSTTGKQQKELTKAEFKKLSLKEQRKHLQEKYKHRRKFFGGKISKHLLRENDVEPKLNDGNREYARALAAGLGSPISD